MNPYTDAVRQLIEQIVAMRMPGVDQPHPWDPAPKPLSLDEILADIDYGYNPVPSNVPVVGSGMTPRESRRANREFLSQTPDPMFRPWDIESTTVDIAPGINPGNVVYGPKGHPHYRYNSPFVERGQAPPSQYFPEPYKQFPEMWMTKHPIGGVRPRLIRRLLPPPMPTPGTPGGTMSTKNQAV